MSPRSGAPDAEGTEPAPKGYGPLMALRQKRWWIVWAIVVAVVAWLVLYGRAAGLHMAYEGPDDPVRPGELATVRSLDGACIGDFPRVFEPYILGMWRQTHPQRSPWWAPGPSGASFGHLACSIGGTGTGRVPDDVTADRIALCDHDRGCVEVRVDHSE
jgi:hypothetical protein